MSHTHSSASEPREHLQHALDHAAHFLPAQGPIGVFIHHNTLHAFQHEPFEKAVVEAARRFQTEPYMSEAAYQADRLRGRILHEDIDAVLAEEEDAEIIPGKLTRQGLRRAMLIPGVHRVNGRNIRWHVEEGSLLQAFRGDLEPTAARALASDTPAALWKVCSERLRPSAPSFVAKKPVRPRDAVLSRFGIDIDLLIHPPLIRLTGAFVDQGIAYWPMPLREEGLLKAARRIMTSGPAVFPSRLAGAHQEFLSQEISGMDATAVVLGALERLAVSPAEWEEFITAELIALAGWAGLVRQLEIDPTLAPHDRVKCSLMEFLALRLTYTLAVLEDIAGDTTTWRSFTTTPPPSDPLIAVARLYDTAQLTGLSSDTLAAMPEDVFDRLAHEIAACGEIERRRLLHLAYERRHERQILIPLAKHRALPPLEPPTDRLAAQAIFCIDEREESVRRALEEVDPSIETYGAAGFFGCAIDYAGIDDAHGVSLCPVVVKPAHAVREVPLDEDAATLQKRQKLRQKWAALARGGDISSRTLVRGWLSTAFLGFFSLFPLVLRVLRPLTYARLMDWLNARFLPEPRTELAFTRDDPESREAATGLWDGFSTQEKVDRVASVLGPAGLHKGHARLVIVLGHGSTSLNNPHESAHDCGACGGRRGGPNARVFAAMANRPAVREGLRGKGIIIPEDTWFIGGYHDTCNDNIDLYDLDLMPDSHRGDLARVRQSLDKARALSAHERARRFEAALPNRDAASGLRHVQERAEHLGEPRPEYGHCTNAVAIVGRRETTRGLFFDRRAFLVSYDATKDLEDKALAAVLGAVIPVCGGISLEYYFSTVDNEVLGCGTKLPHNVTGLVGVMNGMQGDLRTGLPWQMVEIHEPVRILFVVENAPEVVLGVIHANPELKEWLENRWIRLACVDAGRASISVYRGGGVFEPLEGDDVPLPRVRCSADHYWGHRHHLPLARIEPGAAPTAACCNRH
ncbi:MAG: YbcC family protein [Prosthecobacter sp.]